MAATSHRTTPCLVASEARLGRTSPVRRCSHATRNTNRPSTRSARALRLKSKRRNRGWTSRRRAKRGDTKRATHRKDRGGVSLRRETTNETTTGTTEKKRDTGLARHAIATRSAFAAKPKKKKNIKKRNENRSTKKTSRFGNGTTRRSSGWRLVVGCVVLRMKQDTHVSRRTRKSTKIRRRRGKGRRLLR